MVWRPGGAAAYNERDFADVGISRRVRIMTIAARGIVACISSLISSLIVLLARRRGSGGGAGQVIEGPNWSATGSLSP